MQGGRDPFSGFGSPFGSFGGFGSHRSLMSSFFGGRDPFDDPFFTQPFGSMFESGFLGPSAHQFLGSNQNGFPEAMFFGPSRGQFMGSHPTGFLEQHPVHPTISRGPIIEELDSDDENKEKETGEKGNPRKHGRLSEEPIVEVPDDETEEPRSKQTHYGNEFRQMQHFQPQPQAQSFSFQSSTVTYGGANGAYYTSSRTRRTGSDGLTFEESKEANSATGKANHKISRGIHDKGHSVTRKLNPDGRVDTMQALHNLNEDELSGFEDAWKGKAKRHLPGWREGCNPNDTIGAGSSGGANMVPSRGGGGGWALPSTETLHQPSGMDGQPIANKRSTATRKEHKRGGRHVSFGN